MNKKQIIFILLILCIKQIHAQTVSFKTDMGKVQIDLKEQKIWVPDLTLFYKFYNYAQWPNGTIAFAIKPGVGKCLDNNMYMKSKIDEYAVVDDHSILINLIPYTGENKADFRKQFIELTNLLFKKGANNVRSASPSTTTRPKNNARINSPDKVTSLINKPLLKPQMSPMQMVMHPFGILKSDVSIYSAQKVADDVQSVFKENVNYDPKYRIVTATRPNNKGHDMSYCGFLSDWMSCCFREDGSVLAYSFEFKFYKDKYSSDFAVSLAQKFVEDLKRENIVLNRINGGRIIEFEGKHGIRTVSVRVSEGSQIESGDSWGLFIDIRFF